MASISQLHHLCRLYGVQASYLDMRGQQRDAAVESLIAVLRMLGSDVESPDNIDRAVERRERELWERTVEPVLLAWNGKLRPVSIRTGTNAHTARHCELTLEDGSTEAVDIRPKNLRMRRSHQIGSARHT